MCVCVCVCVCACRSPCVSSPVVSAAVEFQLFLASGVDQLVPVGSRK